MESEATEPTNLHDSRIGRHLMSLVLGTYPDVHHLVNDVVGCGRNLHRLTIDRLHQNVKINPMAQEVNLRLVTGADLGITGDKCFLGDFYDLVFGRGLSFCPSEVAPLVSLHTDELEPTWIVTGLNDVLYYVNRGKLGSFSQRSLRNITMSPSSVHMFVDM